MDESQRMAFEFLNCQVLGRRIGYQTASLADSPKYLKKYLKRVIKVFLERIDKLDMDSRLRERLYSDLSGLEKAINEIKVPENTISLFYSLLMISRLLGYDWIDGKIYRDPVFLRTLEQEVWDKRSEDKFNYWKAIDTERKNLQTRRLELIKALLGEGLSTTQIAYLLKTTDYEIKKIKREIS